MSCHSIAWRFKRKTNDIMDQSHASLIHNRHGFYRSTYHRCSSALGQKKLLYCFSCFLRLFLVQRSEAQQQEQCRK